MTRAQPSGRSPRTGPSSGHRDPAPVLVGLLLICLLIGVPSPSVQARADEPIDNATRPRQTGAAAAPVPAACRTDRPLGTFSLIGVRAVSGAAATAPRPDAPPWPETRTLRFGDDFTWHDGRTCGDPRLVPSPGPYINPADPMLADLQVPPSDDSAPDWRANRALDVFCGSERLGGMTVVDPRLIVVVSPNGAWQAIFERPASPEAGARLRAGLAAAGYVVAADAGLPALRDAAGLFIARTGSAYRFADTALSQNLLQAFGIGCPAASERPDSPGTGRTVP